MTQAHIRNELLFEKLNNLAVKTIDFLTKSPIHSLPKKHVYSFEITSPKGYTKSEERKIDYYQFLYQSISKILDFPEFQEFAKYLVSVETFTNRSILHELVKNDSSPYISIFSLIFCPFLERYFDSIKTISFQAKPFRDIYLELENFLFNKNELYFVISPLVNFNCHSQEVILDAKLKIRKLNEAEKTSFINTKYSSPGFQSPLDGLDILDFSYTFEAAYNYNKNEVFDITFGNQLFEKVVTALRLFKKGSTDFTLLRYESQSWDPLMQRQYGETNNPRFDESSTYFMNEQETKSFGIFWKNFENNYVRIPNFIKIAIQRFNIAIEEAEIENKIMDYSISLEALYLSNNPELAFRLSNRMAVLLGQSDDERIKIADFIQDVYDLRSLIAHGEDIKNTKKFNTIIRKHITIESLLERLEELVRKSINDFIVISKVYGKQKILSELDRSLLSLECREKLQRLVLIHE